MGASQHLHRVGLKIKTKIAKSALLSLFMTSTDFLMTLKDQKIYKLHYDEFGTDFYGCHMALDTDCSKAFSAKIEQ